MNGELTYQLVGTIMDDENTSLQEYQTQICLDVVTSKVSKAKAQIILINNKSVEEEWNFNLIPLK